MKLHTKIFIGLVAGAVCGLAANFFAGGAGWVHWFATNVAGPVGQIFLRLLLMTVVPLVFTSITLGVAQLGDIRKVGRVGGRSLAYFLVSTVISAVIGIVLVNLVRPGDGVPVAVRQQLLDAYHGQVAGMQAGGITAFGADFFVNIVPRNPFQAAANLDMLGILFFALVFGSALTLVPAEKARPVVRLLDAVSETIIRIIGMAMRLAPYGVFGLIFVVTSLLGWDILQKLLVYVLVVLAGLLIHGTVTLSGAGRPADPRDGDPVPAGEIPGWVEPARLLAQDHRQPCHRLLHQLEQRHPPDQHPGGGAGAEDPAAHRRVRLAAGLHDVPQRHRAV